MACWCSGDKNALYHKRRGVSDWTEILRISGVHLYSLLFDFGMDTKAL